MKLELWGTLLSLVICAARSDPNLRYHNNTDLVAKLRSLAAQYPHFASVYTIGKSAEGVELEVIRLAGPHVPVGTPHVKIIGNIHGNEPVGRELLIRLAEYLLTGYQNGDDESTRILDSTYVHLLPSMNPDGFRVAQEGACGISPGRRNSKGVDLNRNFPSALYPEDVDNEVQPETQAVMEWMHKTPFILSAALHGGAVVANYPYDAAISKDYPNVEHKTEDDELFKALAANYSWTHGHMAEMNECPNDPSTFEQGIVNGAAWYPVTGSMQDYNYDFHGCLELTLELSCCKFPGPHELDRYWEENKNALLAFLKHSQLGIKGVVRNGSEPIAGATVTILRRKNHQITSEQGEYWKILLPGIYFIQVEKDGFKTILKKVVVPPLPSENPVIHNFDLGDTSEEEEPIEAEIASELDVPIQAGNWPFDPSVFEAYDEAWKAKVEERKRIGYSGDEEDSSHSSALAKRLNKCIVATAIVLLIVVIQ